MQPNEIAAQIIKIYKDEKDELLRTIQIASLLNSADSMEVINAYKKIKTGEIKVAEVTSSVELTAKQKKELELKISKQIDTEIVFVYRVNSIVKGLEIKIGDSLININTGWY